MVGNLRELIPAFFVGPNGEQLSADEIARRRDVAASLLAQATDTSPTAGGGASVLAKAIQGLSYGINEGRARRASQANAEASQANIAAMLGDSGSTTYASAFPPAPAAGDVAALTGGAPDVASARVEQAHGNGGGGFLPQSFLGALDSTEGAGNYDTLFGHAQRDGGRFAGTRVSQMPISDVLAFADPRGAYGQHVKKQVGRVATPMGRGQIVGTTLRKAVGELGIDPSTPFNADTQHQIMGHLARRRIAGAQTMDGKIANLRSEWEGFKSVPRAQMEQIVRDLEGSPTNAVAANEALATGQLQGGLTPASFQSWAEQNYAPGAVDRSVLAPVAAPTPEVLVAESPEDIAAAELAMNDPAFTGPAVVEAAPATAPAPVVAPQVAQALTAMPVNDALPMAGSVDNPRPIVPAAPQNPMQGLNPAVVQALSNPNATAQERSVAQALLQQHVAQNQALQEQARKQAEQANMLAQRRGLAGRMGIDPNYAVDDTIWKAATEANFRDPASYSAGSFIRNSDGTLQQVPDAPTGDIKEYEYALQNGYQGSFTDYQQAIRRAGATTVDTGTIPQGYQAVRDDNGRIVRYEPIPGGPADTSSSDALKESSALTATDVVTRAAQRARDALKAPGLPSTGLAGRALANIPESNAAELRRQVEVLKSNAKVENLNAMRAASPTGGALGSVTEKEAEMLAAKSGSLDPDSPNILRDLNDYERTMLRIVHGREEGDKIYKELYGDDKGESSADGWITLPNGVKIRPKGAN